MAGGIWPLACPCLAVQDPVSTVHHCAWVTACCWGLPEDSVCVSCFFFFPSPPNFPSLEAPCQRGDLHCIHFLPISTPLKPPRGPTHHHPPTTFFPLHPIEQTRGPGDGCGTSQVQQAPPVGSKGWVRGCPRVCTSTEPALAHRAVSGCTQRTPGGLSPALPRRTQPHVGDTSACHRGPPPGCGGLGWGGGTCCPPGRAKGAPGSSSPACLGKGGVEVLQ